MLAENPSKIRSFFREKNWISPAPENSDTPEITWWADPKKFLFDPIYLEKIASFFWAKFEKDFEKSPFQIAGFEMGAVPILAAISAHIWRAKKIKINAFFLRRGRKKSGLVRAIEGTPNDYRVIFVDDVLASAQHIQRAECVLAERKMQLFAAFFLLDFEDPNAAEFLKTKNWKTEKILSVSDFGVNRESDFRVFSHSKFRREWTFAPLEKNYALIAPKSAPAVCESSESVFFGANDSNFYAIDLLTGREKWRFACHKHNVKGILSSPKIWGEMVFFGAYDGNLYALEKRTGSEIWRYPFSDFIGSSPEIAAEKQLIFVGLEHGVEGERGSIVALDARTGAKKWEYFVAEFLHGSPRFVPKKNAVLIGTNDSILFCFDADSGALRWKFFAGAPIKHFLTPDLPRNQICAGTNGGDVFGIDLDSGAVNFRFSAKFSFYSTPLVFKNTLFATSADRNLYIFDLQKNKLLQKISTASRIFSSPTEIGGRIFFGSNDGFVRVFDPQKNKIVDQICFPERILTPIIFSQKFQKFFAGGAGNQLFCFSEN